ncbi:threonine--tRNA ligase [Patescibacteria group bacterium]|nr:threonine--tRNA ligase [Patescibacteria group bacterium]MBU4023180.1 threonine--tRNA ligase [Patescibacteria group bacterium]
MKLETFRHSLSHIMAAAVQELYPGTKFGIGPAIENGFYYDFDLPKQISESEFPEIQKKMQEIIKKNLPFEKKQISKTEANKIFKDQPYKLELVDELAKSGAKISIYQVCDFIDLCKGPHLKSTKEIPLDGFKLTKVAGAYWRGHERNKMLTRIYGTGWTTKKDLNKYLENIEKAEQRDHRILGSKLELFMFDNEVGAGLPIWMPNGAMLRHIIEGYLYEQLYKAGYQWLSSFHIAKLDLWKTSGHWGFYRENMYSPIKVDEEEYMLKPMNCPFHIKVYNSKIRSYKDLPIRFAELGTVYRYEKSGVLHGLARVRGFTQDDAHIFCTPEQLSEELFKTIKLAMKMLGDFGFKDYQIYLSTQPEKYVGTNEIWNKATKSLKYALDTLKIDYEVDKGGGAFYGPKIDIKIKDSLGRPWQCSTIQVDFNLPQRFKMSYIDEKGKKREPIMIHRALLGAMERFIAVLIEHTGGAFPLWLSPIQLWVLPISEKHIKYAQKITNELKEAGFRTEIKNENETIGKKIRNGEIQKIPYILVVGDKEIKDKIVSVRQRGKGDIGKLSLPCLIKKLKSEVEKRSRDEY